MDADKKIEERWDDDGLIGVVNGKVVEASEDYLDWEPDEEVRDAAPRTLYVRRDVVNADEIAKHYEEQGVSVDPVGLHVTIAYSRAPVDWIAVGEDWNNNTDGKMTVPAGGARLHEMFGPQRDTLVLQFTSSRLAYRHEDIKRSGASWDWPDYQPHVTLAEGVTPPDNLQPWRGKIELGPEIFEEVKQ